jgi:hypothetical protein
MAAKQIFQSTDTSSSKMVFLLFWMKYIECEIQFGPVDMPQ